ncbi:Gamma-aminobutyric acid type B receptor subunit 2 [Channa argus]|uniref:Gamma-aminobutyric acid type B receptor subunit 2 n=1 Tax=Channa argus TaxID=215402 RepID=A0A6G1PQJ5_CHAAH|nr:Gamma-aminobutyric acid type B receptor subunit 2 [Channa argus]
MEPCGCVEVSRLLLMLLCWPVVGSVLAPVRHPLPVLWMMPVSSGSGRGNLTAVAPAVRLALQDLKKQPPPLGNYEIQLQLLDSQCDPPTSLKALFDAMWAGPKYLLLFGGVCPPVTALIARSLPALSLVQVSFGIKSPSLSNKKSYGNLFSTMPSDRALNQAALKLLQRYKWTRVGIITQEGSRLSEMKNDLMRQLLKADVQVISTGSLSDDACSSLKRLKERDVRIIIGQFEEDSASEVFCCAYRLNLFGPRYQWIVVDGGSGGWRLGWQESGCTANSLLMAADGSIRLQIRPLSNKNTPGISGRTPVDYQDSYLQQLIQEGSEVSPLHSFAYDAVWVAARALGQVMEAVKHREKYSVQRNVTVREEEVQKMLLEAVKSTLFEGVTGPVFFRNGERMALIELIQFQGPGPARDQALVHLQRHHVSLLLFSMVSSAAVGTIFISLLIILCLRRPRSSGGSQDQLLLLGVLLSSSSVLVSGLDGSFVSDWTLEIFCSVSSAFSAQAAGQYMSERPGNLGWFCQPGISAGSSVDSLGGTHCGRRFTVHQIMESLFTRQHRNKDTGHICAARRAPVGCVCFNLLANTGPPQTGGHTAQLREETFVLISLSTGQQDYLENRDLKDHPMVEGVSEVVWWSNKYFFQTEPADQDAIIRPFSEHCSSTNMDLWLTAVYGCKAPLLGLGCFVAWSIRSVQVEPPAVSSKHLTLCMFAVTAFSVSGVLASLLISHNPSVQFCLSSILILCCCIFILSWTFVPMLSYLWCGGSERQRPSELQSEAAEQEDGGSVSRLNQQLKSRTAQLDVEIETLTMQLCETSESEEVHVTTISGEIRPDEDQDGTCERQAPSPDHINSPEHVQRRLSVQLPILHHSYLPAVGGVSSSSSSVFGSQEELVTTITSADHTQRQPRYR